MTAGLILAAGVSGRMGRFKPMLPIGNTSFIRKLISKMREAGTDGIVVVTGYRQEELTEHLADLPVDFVYNERFYESQMLDSVKLGLGKARELFPDLEAVLLSPADAVMSPVRIFREVLESPAAFARPVYQGEPGHPVLIRSALFSEIENYTGEGGLRGVVEASGVKLLEIPADGPEVLLDADTREDYRKVAALSDRMEGETGKLHFEMEMKLVSEQVICGEGFLKLLELTEKAGSLSAAASALRISYSKVWKIVRYAEAAAGTELIGRTSGGEEGGRSILTEKGKEFLRRYKAMRAELDRASAEIFDRHFQGFRF